MSELTLPPVAKSFYTLCKKCEADRYHKVLAHTTPRTAKIECEVCHSKKTYTIPKPGASKTSKVAIARAASSRRSHSGDFENRSQKSQAKDGAAYSIKGKFSEDQKLNHAKFGIGFVVKVYDHKIDVMFSDEVKTLMHNRV